MIKFIQSPDIHLKLRGIISTLRLDYLKPDNIICFKSVGSKSSTVHARCWNLPKIWQLALDSKPHYIIEVLSEQYDYLSEEDKTKLLIHELLHIPKSFTGGLRPHKGYVNSVIVNKLYEQFVNNSIKQERL